MEQRLRNRVNIGRIRRVPEQPLLLVSLHEPIRPRNRKREKPGEPPSNAKDRHDRPRRVRVDRESRVPGWGMDGAE